MPFDRNEILYDLQRAAMERGGRIRVASDGKAFHTSIIWKVSGTCESPVTIERYSRPDKRHRTMVLPRDGLQRNITMEVPCRKCRRCLQYKAFLWRSRAAIECGRSSRTWFATLTFTPAQHEHFANEARAYCFSNGLDYEALAADEQFRLRCSVPRTKDRPPGGAFRHVTLWLKRLRKSTGAAFVYLVVTEAHKSGLPHFHALLHERKPETPLRHKALGESWNGGFSNFKLIEPAKVGYVTKYISKSSGAQVRASLRYGASFTNDAKLRP